MGAMKERLNEILDILYRMELQSFASVVLHLQSLGYSEDEINAAIKHYVTEGSVIA